MNASGWLVAVAAVMASGCAGPGPGRPATEPAAVIVEGVAARLTTIREPIDVGGTVAAETSAAIASRIGAVVQRVAVRAGDRVRAGQLLIELDDRDLGAAAAQARAASTAAEYGLVGAESDRAGAGAEQDAASAWHTRIEALQAQRSATPQELDDAVARLAGARAHAAAAAARIDQARAHVTAARASADAAAIAASFARITAPFDGSVAERLVDPGDLASPGMTLLRLDGTGQRRVDVRIDEARASLVAPGDSVEVTLGSEAASRPVPGRVIETARAVGVSDRAFTVKIQLPAGVSPVTGTFARVRLQGPQRDALVIPTAAVRQQGQVATAFVADADRARLRLLQLGMTTGAVVEVLGGLDSGEDVIVHAPATLRDGNRVSLRRVAGAAP